jgi:hypothetical protein
MNQSDAYTQIAERHGYGGSERYRRILEFLMSPLQAEMAIELPCPPEELAQKFNLDVERVKAELDDLYIKGVVFPRNFETREHYRLARSVYQLHDSTQSMLGMDPHKEPELFQLWQDFTEKEWDPDRARDWMTWEHPIDRVIPAYRALPDSPEVLPYEDIRQILRGVNLIAVCSCSCRKRFTAIGQPCSKSGDENCLQFNRAAEYFISRVS